MLSLIKLLAGLLIAIGAVVLGLWLFVPSEQIEMPGAFEADLSDPDAYLAAREAAFDDITPGAEARIIWAGAPGARSDTVVLYLHGFSATSEEIRPVPDLVAQELGANLMFARLRGHGRTGEAFADATGSQWVADTAEALAIARQIGDRVVVIGVSTGATLAAIAATEPDMAEGVAAIAMISANFRLASPVGALLDWPGASLWVPWVAGQDRSFEAQNEAHATYWTTAYPTRAVFSLAATMREARGRSYAQVQTPLLMIYAQEDQVVSSTAIEAMAERWGGPVTLARQTLPSEGVDPFAHVIAGDILSPAMTQITVDQIVDWARPILDGQ